MLMTLKADIKKLNFMGVEHKGQRGNENV